MDTLLLILIAIAGLALAGAIWLLIERARLAGQTASSRAKLDTSESARALLEADAKDRAHAHAKLAAENRELAERRSALESRLSSVEERHARELAARDVRLADLRREFEEREGRIQAFVAQRDAEMTRTFKALSADTLKDANEKLLQLASQQFTAQQKLGIAELEKRELAVSNIVKPIAETLQRADERLTSLQKEWTQDRSTLQAEIKALGTAGETLRLETTKLSHALSKPEVRGRYGEIQLRRVAELSGMISHCDFFEQESQQDSEGKWKRPDMVVRLPNDRSIAVDAKCNIFAYLQAIDAATEEERERCLERFSDHVAEQVTALGKKAYWSEFEGSPEFVVMFVPGDQFVDAALARKTDLIERAAADRVILASPSTLIGLLRAVAVGWREKRVEDQARELIALGKEFHERAATAFGYVSDLGAALEKASAKYNDFVASYERRLEPTLRKFEEADVKSKKDLPDLEPIALRVREIPASRTTDTARVPSLDSRSPVRRVVDGEIVIDPPLGASEAAAHPAHTRPSTSPDIEREEASS
jgi:DNA recombination protein RmuC